MVLAISQFTHLGVPVVVFEANRVTTADSGRSAAVVADRVPPATGELVDGFAIMPWSGDTSDDRRFGEYSPEPTRSQPSRPGLRDFEAKIRRYNSDLKPVDPAFRAAVILLAGLEYGHNIDVLARKTGYDRSFVARTVRRLIDNGVWKAGVTVAEWTSSDEASGTFWNDVAVAEGKMCRRIGADGRIEWAPAGFWNKNFQFVDPGADKRLATLYLDPAPSQPAPAGPVAPGAAPAGADATPSSETPAQPSVDAADTELVGPEAAQQTPDSSQAPAPPKVPKLDELFRDVIWIG